MKFCVKMGILDKDANFSEKWKFSINKFENNFIIMK